MTDQSRKDITKADGQLSKSPAKVSRRALIKGGVTAMPAILTLHSGASLARSSNLISPGPTELAADYTICVDKSSVEDLGNDIYDLGPTRDAHVTLISNENSYYKTEGKNDPITPRAMCETGSDLNHGPYWWKPDQGEWNSAQLPQGFVVSAGSYSSFAFDVSKSFME